jgi:hypothetical protein
MDMQLGVNVTGNVGFNPFGGFGSYGYHGGNPSCNLADFFKASFPSQRMSQYWFFNRA